MKRHFAGGLPLLALLTLTISALSACSSDRVAVPPDLPPTPASLRAPCKHPALVIGADARAVIARYAAELKACNARRAQAVAFNDDLRKGLAGK